MKKLSICLAIVGFLFSCNQKSSVESGKRDSAYTSIVYAFNADQNDYRTTTALRVCYDTVIVARDSTATHIDFVHKAVRDTQYRVPILFSKPDSLNGKPLLDSVGKPKVKTMLLWPLLTKGSLLIDYNKRWH
jgi:hypothetical protein